MKISIVVATYNDKEHLKQTLESILTQDYADYECIVADGKSTDGTADVLAEYEKKFIEHQHFLKWTSEPDKGIYDAINKGILQASGEVIGILYDLYANPHVLSKIADIMEAEHTDGVHGDLEYREGNRVIRFWKMGQGKIKDGWLAGHPTLYLKKEIYEKYGLYKTDYKCSGDYEFQVRAFGNTGVRLSYLPEVLVYMFYGGTSSSSLNAYLTSLKEGNRALKENGYKNYWLITIKRTIKVLLQFMKRK